MSEETKRPKLKKFLSFFVEAPKKAVERTKTMSVSFADSAAQPVSQIGKLKLFFTKSPSILRQKTKDIMESFTVKLQKSEEIVPNTSKVSSIGKFTSFFKRASVQIEEQTHNRMEGLKRCITAQSKMENNCNSSLAISQLDDQLIDRNAASFANMTLELSMNTNVLHQMALPSKDTNQSHRELMFDVTSNPILERSESQEINILDQDQAIEKEEQQNEHSHVNKLLSFIFKAPENIKRKSTQTFDKLQQTLVVKKSSSKEKLQKGVMKIKIAQAFQPKRKSKAQQEKLAGFFTKGPQLMKKKTLDFFVKFQNKLQITSREPSQQNENIEQDIQNIEANQSVQEYENEFNQEEEILSQKVNSHRQQNEFSEIDDKASNIEWDPQPSEKNEANDSRGPYTNQEEKIPQQEITHIKKNSNHQDSSYSDAGQMFDIMNQQSKNLDQQSKIYVQENQSSQMTSKIFNKEEIKQQYEDINKELKQLQYEKLHLIPQRNVVIKSPFKPNYKKLAEISDDNEALYKAKDLIRKMNQERREKQKREKHQYDKIDEYFHNLQYMKQSQEEMKNRYESQRKQQIQGRIEDYQKKQREFAQLQQISHNFIKKLVNVGPQQGKLAQELEDSVIQIKGGYRKVKLKGLGIELPKINQNNPQYRRYVNEELVKSKQDDMIRKYEASKLAILKSSN